MNLEQFMDDNRIEGTAQNDRRQSTGRRRRDDRRCQNARRGTGEPSRWRGSGLVWSFRVSLQVSGQALAATATALLPTTLTALLVLDASVWILRYFKLLIVSNLGQRLADMQVPKEWSCHWT